MNRTSFYQSGLATTSAILVTVCVFQTNSYIAYTNNNTHRASAEVANECHHKRYQLAQNYDVLVEFDFWFIAKKNIFSIPSESPDWTSKRLYATN